SVGDRHHASVRAGTAQNVDVLDSGDRFGFDRFVSELPGPCLLLIRHGQIRANAESRWHGATDSPLTRSGRRQAARVARFLRSRHAIDALYSSPLARCRSTAAAIGAALDRAVVVDDDLREYGIGEWEDLPYRQLAEEHGFFKRISDDPDYAPLGGDSLNAVAR